MKPTPTPIPEPTPTPTPTYPTITVPLQGQKILRNGSLSAGQFTFELRDKAGKLLAQVTNAADGSVVFPDRTFSRIVSNYVYTIREIAGSDKTISYDSTVYTVKITTTAAAGKLRAAVSLEKDGVPYAGKIVFTNTRELPKTGDNYLGTASLMAIVSMLMGVAWLLGGKRGRLNGKKSDMQ